MQVNMNKPSKVLMICYDFYPEGKPNTYRWFNIAKKWVEQGIEVHVVTADKNQYSSYEEVEGVRIYRSTEYLIGKLKYNYRDAVNVNAVATDKAKTGGVLSFIKRLARKVYDLTWSNLYWPDHSFLWTFSAVPLASKIIKEHNIDKLITVSWTFSAHRIGDKLKQKFPKIYWLADTIDPFSFNGQVNNTFLYSKLNTSYEKKIFSRADFNSVLTERIREKYVSMFPSLERKIGVNHNIFIPVDFDYSKVEKESGISTHIVFLGTLNKDVRPPANTLKLFSNFIKKYPNSGLRIDFYGDFAGTLPEFEKYPELLNKFVFLHGFINRDEVNRVIKDADVLLNIGNSNKYQEPSKLIEYMCSGKKILNVCCIEEDTAAELLKNYPLSMNVMPNYIDNDKTFEMLAVFFANNTVIDKQLQQEGLNKYMLNTVSDKYLTFLSLK
jgi:glycosyltransferase involved in cell wall biosynthesis